jgi:hypothetical protein
MNTTKHLLERWWRPLLFAAWIWALTGLLQNGRYTAFLRPQFGYVLVLGTFVLFGFLLTGMPEARRGRFGIPHALRALILLLPLAHLWNARGASLDVYALQNRSLGLPIVDAPGGGPDTESPRTSPPPKQDELAGLTGGQSGEGPATESPRPASPPKSVTIGDLYYAPRAYEGKRVRLIGMLHKNDPKVKESFGESLLIVFRFVVTCCAADASPMAVLVDGEDLPDLA